jgi:ubiquinone/menaquinone biosynthesis C-methylase UbiE
MTYDDNTFDLVIDKGTYDALACGDISTPEGNLLREMMRVLKPNGFLAEITNGTEVKRLKNFENFLTDYCKYELRYHKLELSADARMINILRSKSK